MESRADIVNVHPSILPPASRPDTLRLAELASYRIIGSPAEPAFDDLAALAAELCGARSAAIVFCDEGQWTKAAVELDRQTLALAESICAQTLLQADLTVIPDLRQDPRFSQHPAVADASGVHFYAGATLRSTEGTPLGMLCVLDEGTHPLSERQAERLRALARQVMALLEMRRLGESRRRDQLIIDSAVDYAIFSTDLDGCITSWSEGATRVLGWSAEEMLGQSAERIYTEEDRATHEREREMRGARDCGCATDERWHLRKDGSRLWGSGEMMPLRDEAGQMTGFIKILRDRTDLRREQMARVEAEERYRALIDLSPQALRLADARGRVTFANAYWCDYTGLGPEASLGDGWLQAVCAEERARVEHDWRAVIDARQPYTLELPLTGADGSVRWFQERGVPELDAGGAVTRWMCVAHDIDARRRADTERLESEAFTRLLVDSASEGFFSIDRNGAITLCNEAFVKLLGMSGKEQALGKPMQQVIHRHNADGSPVDERDCPIQRTARTGEPAHINHELFFRQDGSSLSVEYRVEPIWREGELQGAICTFTDISERARGEALQSYLLELSDRLQDTRERVDVPALLGERLGKLMGCDRLAYGHVSSPDSLTIHYEWTPPGRGSSLGQHGIGHSATLIASRLQQGEPVVIDDLEDGHYDEAALAVPQRLGCRSLMYTPLFEQSPQPTFLLLACERPRHWTQNDLTLVREVVDRIRAANERAQANTALREAEQRVSLANEIASIGVWEYNNTRNTLHLDAQLRAMAGLTPDHPSLRVDELLARLHPDDRSRFFEALHNALDGDNELNLDYRVFDPQTNRYLWLANRGRRVTDASGEVRIIGTARDITEERNAAQELLRINTLLEEQIAERRQAERRQAALIELGDLLREQPDSATIATAAERVLSSTLGVARVAFASIDPTGEYATMQRSWIDEKDEDPRTQIRFADFGDLAYDLRAGELVAIDDIQHDVRTATSADAYERRNIRSLVCVPLLENARLSAALVILDALPRHWADDDISFIRDVADRAWTADERIRAERALRESEEQFRTLADNMSQFAWTADPSGRIYWYNKRWYDYTGTTFEAMRALGWRSVHHPEHMERVSASMKRAFAIGSIWEDTFPLRGKDGKYRWFLSRALPIRNELGQVTHWLGTNTDITAQVAAEEALRELNDNLERRVAERTRELAEINHRLHREMSERERAEEALRHAQKMEAIGQLTGGLAHDFNNMLTGVLGALDLIQRRVTAGRTGELDRYIDAAVTSANRAAALTHRLLAFARRQSLDPKPVDVDALVGSMEDMLRRTMGERIRLQTHLTAEPWLAYTDAPQLENALLNLVINARDAMPEGGELNIETRCVSLASHQPDGPEAGDYVVLCVSDSGLGMPAEIIAKAFDPFFTTKPIGQGTGLGLSMVYGFAKQTGGHVRIDSQVGVGTRITLYLPRNQEPVDAQGEPRTANSDIPRAQLGETVLVVEDEAAVRLLVIEVLKELGYRALEAVDGPSALPYLQGDQRIDLLVTDVGLPGMNGRQLAEIARQHRKDLKVLFITGYAPNAEVRGEFLGPGMDMLAKPFNIDALAGRIRQMIEG
ncbi:PAS domain-containing protein [Stutzerimonas nosocomialis]|uniref:PAS domain S-box protein n=1 Tax=Stutzerimonas nosocomialis TaxID=1056496 RepID=UPI001108AE2D|nr:PAS domain-containing protein [Stutzerimonas nosocomialis]